MDPLGFALENYDAIGAWRTHEGESPIDAAGELPDGTKFENAEQLMKMLIGRRDQFQFFGNGFDRFPEGGVLERPVSCRGDGLREIIGEPDGVRRLPRFGQQIMQANSPAA
jgi:hypothetical protein